MNSEEKINVWGARVHNLKNIDVEIPRASLTVITGLSGAGIGRESFDISALTFGKDGVEGQ